MVSEPDTRQCVSEEAKPRWGLDWGVPHRLEKRTSTNEDAGPQRGVDCEIPHRLEENEAFFIRVWKPLSSRRILKILKRSLKGKAQRGQYLLAVGLDCYTTRHEPSSHISKLRQEQIFTWFLACLISSIFKGLRMMTCSSFPASFVTVVFSKSFLVSFSISISISFFVSSSLSFSISISFFVSLSFSFSFSISISFFVSFSFSISISFFVSFSFSFISLCFFSYSRWKLQKLISRNWW